MEKSYHIETNDGKAQFNFFTTATNSKKALQNLLENSHDYKNLVDGKVGFTVKITPLK